MAHLEARFECTPIGELDRLKAENARLTAELADARALIRVAYNAGYYQAECGLPDHGDIHQAATAALEADRKRVREEETRACAEAYPRGIGAILARLDQPKAEDRT